MRQLKLLGIGHSHLSCYQRAFARAKRAVALDGLDARFVQLGDPSYQPNLVVVDTVLPDGIAADEAQRVRQRTSAQRIWSDGTETLRAIDGQLEKRLRHILKREAPDALLLVAMGNEYNSIAMLRHPQPFDFALAGEAPPDLSAAVIDPALMKAQVRYLAERNALLYWRYLSEVTDRPILVVPPPPPIASEEHIRAWPGAFSERVGKYGVSPAGFRRKMWMLYSAVLRETVAGDFVEPPVEVFEGGFLAERFRQEDPTHGNPDYGALMLDLVADRARSRMVERA